MVQSVLAALLALFQGTPAPMPSVSPPPIVSPSPAAMSAQPAAADHLYPGGVLRIAFSNANGPLTPTIDAPLLTWTVDQTSHAITVTALQTLGRATLTVTDASGESIQIPVRVGLDAGKIVASSLTFRYTGNPVDQTWLQRNVQRILRRNVQLQNAVAEPQLAIDLPAALAPGSISALPAQVQIAGTDQYYPVNASVNVNLQNVPAPQFSPPTLFYDDDPEHIPAEGVLYRGRVQPSAPARLYYYHDNTQQPRDLAVVLTATETTDVQLIDASAGPNIDVMGVGHNVTRDFLKYKPANQGTIVTVQAGTPQIIERFQLQGLSGAAGSIDMRIVSGGTLAVTVLAIPPRASDSAVAAMLNGPQLPGDGHNRTGVFRLNGYAQDALAYSVGGDDASITYGLQSPPLAQPGGGHDFGEYGVWRTIDFAVNNAQAQPSTLYLFERPMGGVVRSSFLLNGPLVSSGAPIEVPCARVSERYQAATVTVPPGPSHLLVQTMTDGGSNYPLEVGLTTQQLPTPPPINDRDGCFPKPQLTPAAQATPEPSPKPFHKRAMTLRQ